jgi:aspartate aminotransferase
MNILDCVSLGKIVTIREQLMAAAREGMKVYRFESGDPSFDIHPRIAQAITDATKSGKTHYMPVDGIPELRKAISERARSQGLDVDPSDVFVTNGAMHALFVAYQALHDDRSDNRIAVPDPMWTEAVENIRLAGMEPAPVEFDPEISNYTWKEIKRQQKNLDGVFVNSPHNPTGKNLTHEEKKEIVDNVVSNDMWLIADEAYESITYGEPHTLMASLMPKDYDKWISIHSMSKSFSMSGLRVGWIITKNPKIKSRLSKISRCTINGVNHVTQWAAVEALSIRQDDQYFLDVQTAYSDRRQILNDAIVNDKMASSVLKPVWPNGGFFLWCKVNSKYSADALSEALAKKGLGNAPGECFGEAATTVQALRFSFSVDTRQVMEGSKYLVQLLNDESFMSGLLNEH